MKLESLGFLLASHISEVILHEAGVTSQLDMEVTAETSEWQVRAVKVLTDLEVGMYWGDMGIIILTLQLGGVTRQYDKVEMLGLAFLGRGLWIGIFDSVRSSVTPSYVLIPLVFLEYLG
ncbi:hypothetical protein AAG906_033200 [Vitis piasezkii]